MNKKGFTLIELLVVVLIIGILAAIALPQYKMAVLKSKFATLKDMVNAIASAQERYLLTNDNYTANIENLDVNISYKIKLCANERQCDYYLDDDKKMRFSLNALGGQSIGYWQIDSKNQIAFVYQHNEKWFQCIPYKNEGISYQLCTKDGTSPQNGRFIY